MRRLAERSRRGDARQPARLRNVHFDWDEQTKVIRLDIDQDQARVLGITTQELATFAATPCSPAASPATARSDKQIDVLVRGTERRARAVVACSRISPCRPARGRIGGAVADRRHLDYGFEEGVIWRRNRLPTMTVRADVYGGHPGAGGDAQQIVPQLDADPRQAAAGLLHRDGRRGRGERQGGRLDGGGGAADSSLVVLTVLMLQLQSFSRMAMVLLTAPLGLIGVTLVPARLHVPFGFVAMLGTIALSGMIMRNSVILVDQIEQDIAAGQRAVAGDRRGYRAPLPADRADRRGGGAGDDPAVPQRVLRADGGGDHGRADRGDAADAAVPAGAVCGVVPGRGAGA